MELFKYKLFERIRLLLIVWVKRKKNFEHQKIHVYNNKDEENGYSQGIGDKDSSASVSMSRKKII